jgi:hypothetical protein
MEWNKADFREAVAVPQGREVLGEGTAAFGGMNSIQ